MSLLSPFDEFVDATASWVNSTAQAQPKFALADADFPHFDVASVAPSGHPMGDNDLEALFGIKFPSPAAQPEPPVFDTGLPLAVPTSVSAAYQAALGAVTGGGDSSSSINISTNSLTAPDGKGPNALQLDMLDTLTPAGSPLAISSGYTSPSFQFSPTPALTMCPTVDSTPAPRSNSRCSSRSSFSAQTEDIRPSLSHAAVASAAADLGIPDAANVGADGKLKKQHLCPYEDCARHTRTFRSNADLQRHIRSHRGERPYSCPSPGCGKAYGQQNKMVNHVKQQHPALLSVVQVGRSRRRAPASAPVSAASSRAASVGTISAASTPGTTPVRVPIRAPIAAPISAAGPARTQVPAARAAPYALPGSMTGTHLLPQATARRENLGPAMNLLRQDVFGTQSSMW